MTLYLNIGNDMAVREKSIIGIFDMDNTTISKHTRQFLADAEKAGRVVNVSPELPKSFIICREGDRETVYVSQISTATLMKRRKAGIK